MAIVIEATHSDYKHIKHLSGMVDTVLECGDTPSERDVLLEIQEMLSDALITEAE